MLSDEKNSEDMEKQDTSSEENADEVGKNEKPESVENKAELQDDTSVESGKEQNSGDGEQEQKADDQEKNSPNVDNSL